MFTGIVEAISDVLRNEGGVLVLKRPDMFDDIRKGSSISVSGVCLTIAELDDESMTFDVLQTTRDKSTLGTLQKRSKVNLERALKAGGRYDGHVVQGHVEGVGSIVSLEQKDGDTLLAIDLPDAVEPFVVLHGSIAIDGVSLTVAAKEKNRITIALVPFTLKETTLGKLEKGDTVNIETDILARSAAQPTSDE